MLCEGNGTVGLSLLIHQNEVVHRFYVLAQNFGLFLHDPCRVRFATARSDVRSLDKRKPTIVLHAVGIFFDAFFDPRGIRFSNGDKGHLHSTKLRV